MATPLTKTSAVWTLENPILELGQLGYEINTGLAKVGDGVTAWTALAYGDPITEFSTVTGTTVCVIDATMPKILDYFHGLRLRLRWTSANTGAVTVNLNGLGAKSVRKSISTALSAGDIGAGQILEVVYDAVLGWFQIISTIATTASISGSVTANVATMGAAGNTVTDSTWEYNSNTYRPRTSGSDIGDSTHRVQNLYMGTNAGIDYVSSMGIYRSGVKYLDFQDPGGGMVRIALLGTTYFVCSATAGFLINKSDDSANYFRVNNTTGAIDIATWQATTIAAAYGGTGIPSYTVGDLLYASGTTTLSKLADVATGSLLASGGVGVAPAWQTYATLGIPTGTGANTRVVYWTGTNTQSGDAGLTYDATNDRLTVGTGTPAFTRDFMIAKASAAAGGVGINVSNTTTTGFMDYVLAESATLYGVLARFNSSYSGNFAGATSLALANSFCVQSGSTNNLTLALEGTPIVGIVGTTTTNAAFRLDATGIAFRAASGIHNANSALTNASLINAAGSNGLNIVQTSTSSYTALFLTEDSTHYGGLQRFNSAFVGNYTGTSLGYANSVNFFTYNNSQPFTITGNKTYSLAGTTNTNCGWVNDSTGFKVCELLDIHNTTTEWFSVRKDQTGAATIASLINAGNGTAARAYWAISNSSSLTTSLFLQSLSASYTTSGIRVADAAVISTNKAAGLRIGTTNATGVTVYANDTAYVSMTSTGLVFFGGTTTATAWVHHAAGSTTIAPSRFTSGTLTTGANILAGNMEFLTDDLYFTISTGPARKGVVLNDGTNLTSGRVPFATTNGRLTDDTSLTYSSSTLATPHIKGSGSAPTVTITAAGAGANATTSVSGTDLSGTITVTTSALDTPLANSVIVTLTFNVAYGAAPRVIIMPANAAAWNLASGIARLYNANTTTTTFQIESGGTPLTALTAATYTWNYMVLQ